MPARTTDQQQQQLQKQQQEKEWKGLAGKECSRKQSYNTDNVSNVKSQRTRSTVHTVNVQPPTTSLCVWVCVVSIAQIITLCDRPV